MKGLIQKIINSLLKKTDSLKERLDGSVDETDPLKKKIDSLVQRRDQLKAALGQGTPSKPAANKTHNPATAASAKPVAKKAPVRKANTVGRRRTKNHRAK